MNRKKSQYPESTSLQQKNAEYFFSAFEFLFCAIPASSTYLK